MSLEKMEALEIRVRRLVDLVQELQQTNASLQKQLSLAKTEDSKRDELLREWEGEREHIKSRIEKIIGELDGLELYDDDLEGVAGDKVH